MSLKGETQASDPQHRGSRLLFLSHLFIQSRQDDGEHLLRVANTPRFHAFLPEDRPGSKKKIKIK